MLMDGEEIAGRLLPSMQFQALKKGKKTPLMQKVCYIHQGCFADCPFSSDRYVF